MKFTRTLAIVFLAFGAIGAPAASARPWTLLDMANATGMDDVQLAPSGSDALIDVIRADLKANTFATGYQLISLASGVRTEIRPSLAHPRWSPNGTSIAWIDTASNGATRIATTDTRGTHPRNLTSGTRTIVTFTWSADSKRIAAVETSPASHRSSTMRLRWLSLEYDYSMTQPQQRSIWIVDATSGSERQLTHDGWSYGGPQTDHDPSWSNDDRRIVSVRQPTPVFGDFEKAQYVAIDVGSGVVRPVGESAFFAYPASPGPVFAPDGSAVAYAHTWDGKLPSREDVFVDGKDVSASLDRDLWSCGAGTITSQSGELLASMMDGVAMRLYALDPSGNAPPRALTADTGSVLAYSVARNRRIAYIWSTPTQLPELYVLDPGAQPRQITHITALPSDLPIAPTRNFTWKDAAGNLLHGQLTVAQTATSRTTPLVVEPHGGPQCADDASFSVFAQYLASNGYAYFRPDPPGSDGYGDWSYKAIVGNWGPVPMAADLAGVDALNAAGIGDPARTFVEGGSYGGYLTSWIVTHSDRFRAAVAEVPVTDLMLEYTLSESPNITRRFFGATPATNPQLLAAQSPLTYAAQEHVPLLIVAGLADTRAPYMQAIEFYKALAENGAPVRMLVDPIAGHGPNDPKGLTEWYGVIVAWIAAHGGIATADASLPQ